MRIIENKDIVVHRKDGSKYITRSYCTFNGGYSNIVIDDTCYQIVNGNNITPYIFPEALAILKTLPSPSDLKLECNANEDKINSCNDKNEEEDCKSKYTQLKVATQDLLIELGFSPETLKGFVEGTCGQSGQPSDEVCQKLLDAGILDK